MSGRAEAAEEREGRGSRFVDARQPLGGTCRGRRGLTAQPLAALLLLAGCGSLPEFDGPVQELRTRHFVVTTDADVADVGSAVEVLDPAFERSCRRWGHDPAAKERQVLLFRRRITWRRACGLRESDGVKGGSHEPEGMYHPRHGWISTFVDGGYPLSKTLVHEVNHLVLHDLGQLPRATWLREGIAELESIQPLAGEPQIVEQTLRALALLRLTLRLARGAPLFRNESSVDEVTWADDDYLLHLARCEAFDDLGLLEGLVEEGTATLTAREVEGRLRCRIVLLACEAVADAEPLCDPRVIAALLPRDDFPASGGRDAIRTFLARVRADAVQGRSPLPRPSAGLVHAVMVWANGCSPWSDIPELR